MTLCVGYHDSRIEARTGYMCSNCRNRLSSLLVQMPSLATWLHENIAPSGGAGERVSGTREEPIPLRIDILDYVGPSSSREISATEINRRRALDGLHPIDPPEQFGEASLLDVIASWALLVSEERYDDWPPKDDLATLCNWLHSQLDWIVCQPWVDEMLVHLGDVSQKAERLAPRDPEMKRLKPPCPSCNVLGLVFTRGIGVKCETRLGGCGRSWEAEDYDRLIVVLGSEALGETA